MSGEENCPRSTRQTLYIVTRAPSTTFRCLRKATAEKTGHRSRHPGLLVDTDRSFEVCAFNGASTEAPLRVTPWQLDRFFEAVVVCFDLGGLSCGLKDKATTIAPVRGLRHLRRRPDLSECSRLATSLIFDRSHRTFGEGVAVLRNRLTFFDNEWICSWRSWRGQTSNDRCNLDCQVRKFTKAYGTIGFVRFSIYFFFVSYRGVLLFRVDVFGRTALLD